ncbi:MAG: hypothetical protein KJS92_06905 [Bacteroidetes bacterium]|nr:hypothetical protein [Bacteroidota bacterium]
MYPTLGFTQILQSVIHPRRFISLAFIWLSFALLQAQDLERYTPGKIRSQKPFEAGGGISLGAGFYRSSANISRMAPWNWFVSGSPWVRIYGFNIPFTFTYSETGRSLTHPFHYQFTGASPSYKWATAHLGYRSMSFSDYTVSGVVFNGAGVELRPGKLRLGAFYGIFNPAVAPDTNNAGFGVILPAYKRIGYGTRVGIGSERNYFDLIFFHGKDDPASLEKLPENNKIRPADNVTLSPRFRFTLFKRWFWEADVALSLFTRNVLNDTLPETEILNKVYRLIRVNTTSYGAFAGHLGTGLNLKFGNLFLRARQVSSDYQSMGINLLQDDIREYTANPAFHLFKGRASFSGSYGFYTDNLSAKRANTTIRKIYNTNLNLQPFKRLNLNLGYNNFGTTRSNGLVQMNDSITFSIINESYSGNLNLSIGNMKRPLSLSLFAQQQEASDRNIFTRLYNNNKVTNAGASLNYRFTKIQLQCNGGASYASFFAGGRTIRTESLQAALRKQMASGKLSLGTNLSYTRRYQEQLLQGYVLSVNMQLQCSFGKRHSIMMQGRLMRNNTGIISNNAFTEQRAAFQYAFRF